MTARKDSLVVRNHQRAHPVNLPLLRRILRSLLEDLFKRRHFDLGIHLVGAGEITRLNEAFVHHPGPTDVISFDYSRPPDQMLHGEIFVCVPVALTQARRFRTSWEHELLRYAVHGVLHLCGYDDRTTAQRGKMKRAENAALRRLAGKFRLADL